MAKGEGNRRVIKTSNWGDINANVPPAQMVNVVDNYVCTEGEDDAGFFTLVACNATKGEGEVCCEYKICFNVKAEKKVRKVMLESECMDLEEDFKARAVKDQQCEVCCTFIDHKGQYGIKGEEITLLVPAQECKRRTGGKVSEPNGEEDESACISFIDDNESDCGLVWDAKREICRCPGELKKKDHDRPVEESEYHRKSDGDCVCCDEDEGWNEETEQCTNCLQHQIYIGISSGDENRDGDDTVTGDLIYNDKRDLQDEHNECHGVILSYPSKAGGVGIEGLDIPKLGGARLPSRNTFVSYVKGKLGGDLDGTFVNVNVKLDTSGSTTYNEWDAVGGPDGLKTAIEDALKEIFKEQCCKGTEPADILECFNVTVGHDGSEAFEVMAMSAFEADFTADGKP